MLNWRLEQCVWSQSTNAYEYSTWKIWRTSRLIKIREWKISDIRTKIVRKHKKRIFGKRRNCLLHMYFRWSDWECTIGFKFSKRDHENLERLDVKCVTTSKSVRKRGEQNAEDTEDKFCLLKFTNQNSIAAVTRQSAYFVLISIGTEKILCTL